MSKLVTMRDVLAWIETEGSKAPRGARRGAVDVATPYELAQASAHRALCDVRALLEHGDEAAVSPARGITSRQP